MSTRVKLKLVRISFPRLFKAERYQGNQNNAPRYSANFLIEKGSENDKAIQSALRDAAKDKLGDKWEAKLKAYLADSGKSCYKDGDITGRDECEGHFVLAAYRGESQGAPAVVGPGGPKDKLTEDSGKPYSGCYVNAIVDVYIQTGQYPGARCGLIGVQFAKDGEAFSSAPASADGFETLEGYEEDEADFEGLI